MTPSLAHTPRAARRAVWLVLIALFGAATLAVGRYAALRADSQRPDVLPGVSVGLVDAAVQNRTQGEQFNVRFNLTNEQLVEDTFLVLVNSQQGWPVQIVRTVPPTATTALVITLPAGLSAPLQISMTVPAAANTSDTVVITAVSQSNPLIQDAATFRVDVTRRTYLPIVIKWSPPIPLPPVLDPIANADQDGNYTVSWQAAELATSYSLEEDDNAAFSSPTVVFSGAATSWVASGKPNGTYHYRVRGVNTLGSGPYSNVQSTVVQGFFYADAANLTAGTCTTLRWNFTNVRAVYVSFAYGFDKRGVSGVGSATVCPSITTPFRATVVNQDNSQSEYTFTVNVTGSTCADPYVLRFAPTSYLVNRGERFSIFWEVECAAAVFYRPGSAAEQPVVGRDSRTDVTINQDTLFTLRVVYNRPGSPSDNASFTVRVR